jgi:hypothetical protein
VIVLVGDGVIVGVRVWVGLKPGVGVGVWEGASVEGGLSDVLLDKGGEDAFPFSWQPDMKIMLIIIKNLNLILGNPITFYL